MAGSAAREATPLSVLVGADESIAAIVACGPGSRENVLLAEVENLECIADEGADVMNVEFPGELMSLYTSVILRLSLDCADARLLLRVICRSRNDPFALTECEADVDRDKPDSLLFEGSMAEASSSV